MLKRTLTIALSGLLLAAGFGFQPIQAKTIEDARLAEKARTSVLKVGMGPKARVEVKLRDNTKLKGYVSEAGADSFTVTDSKTGASQAVAYANVAQIKKPGNGLSGRTKAIIAGAAIGGAAIVLYTVRGAFCDGMC